jgi:uncharacterized protein DUF4209
VESCLSLTSDELRRIEGAAAAAVGLHDVVQGLALTDDDRAGALGVVAMAFEYVESFPGEQAAVGTFFKAMMEFDGRRYPPGLDHVSDETVEIWQAAAAELEAPLPRARLNDLCFEGGWGSRGTTGRAAVSAYLEAAAKLGDLPPSDLQHSAAFAAYSALARAVTLARTIDDETLVERACTAIVDAAQRSLDQPEPAAGVALGLAELLLGRGGSLEEFDLLLVTARSVLADDPFDLEQVVRLELRRPGVGDETRAALQRELVSIQLLHAQSREGIARIHFLQEAASLAVDFGVADLREEAIARLQAIGIDDLDLVETRVEVPIPREEVERYLASFSEQETWEDALLLVLAHGPPSGVTPANREQAEKLARETPLLSVVSHMEVGGDGLPRFTATTEDEIRKHRLVRYEMQRAQLTAIFLPEAFERIWGKWGPIDEEALAAFLGINDHVAPELAAALARDFLRFFSDDHEGACYSTAPHVEALVRDVVLAIPLPVYRIHRQEAPGQYPGLGSLLGSLLAHGFDESWARFLHGFLSEPKGLNFRNELLHGFELDPGAANAALLLVCVLYLTRGFTLSHRPGTARADADDEPGSPDAPTGS